MVSPSPFEARSEELDGALVVTVRGELDLGTAPRLEELLEPALASGDSPVAIDLSGCEFIDSTGIALIVKAWQTLDVEGGPGFALCGVDNQVRRLLRITGLESSIPIHPGVTRPSQSWAAEPRRPALRLGCAHGRHRRAAREQPSLCGLRYPQAPRRSPRRRLAIVTCMDSRLDVFAALGLRDGEAHVLRNAGGVITDDVIRSLAVSQRRLGTCEVMLIHHTDCGMQSLTDDGFRAELQEATGVAPAFAIESFDDVDADVRQSILRVRRSAFLPNGDQVRGFVYDVDTHQLREIQVRP